MTYTLPLNLTIATMFDYTNTVTFGYLGNIVILVTFMVMLIALKNYPTEYAFATASFVTFFPAMFLWGLGFISIVPVILIAILVMISVGWLIKETST